MFVRSLVCSFVQPHFENVNPLRFHIWSRCVVDPIIPSFRHRYRSDIILYLFSNFKPVHWSIVLHIFLIYIYNVDTVNGISKLVYQIYQVSGKLSDGLSPFIILIVTNTKTFYKAMSLDFYINI